MVATLIPRVVCSEIALEGYQRDLGTLPKHRTAWALG